MQHSTNISHLFVLGGKLIDKYAISSPLTLMKGWWSPREGWSGGEGRRWTRRGLASCTALGKTGSEELERSQMWYFDKRGAWRSILVVSRLQMSQPFPYWALFDRCALLGSPNPTFYINPKLREKLICHEYWICLCYERRCRHFYFLLCSDLLNANTKDFHTAWNLHKLLNNTLDDGII